MENPIKKILFQNFSRKVFSIGAAFVIWLFVNYSIITTQEFSDLPVRIVNLPQGKTMRGLMPNGILDHRLSVTLTGKKDVLEHLNDKDLEIVIDVANNGDEWIEMLDKKNIVSLNPDIDLIHNISKVDHPEFIMKLSSLITEKVPIYFRSPKGEPPEGYQFLDIFPQRLSQTLTGPEEDIRKLQEEGLEITFDFSHITKDQLDVLHQQAAPHSDEVSLPVPDSWKVVPIPYLHGLKQEVNGPEAKHLRIDFLRNELLPLERDIPIWVFYPLLNLSTMNPLTMPLLPNKWIVDKYGVTVISRPLFVSDVSRLFLDIVRDRIEVVIIADTTNANRTLRWEVQVIDPQALEENYVSQLLMAGKAGEATASSPMSQAALSSQKVRLAERERYLRTRFHEYLKKFQLFESEGRSFRFNAVQEPNGIVINDASRK